MCFFIKKDWTWTEFIFEILPFSVQILTRQEESLFLKKARGPHEFPHWARESQTFSFDSSTSWQTYFSRPRWDFLSWLRWSSSAACFPRSWPLLLPKTKVYVHFLIKATIANSKKVPRLRSRLCPAGLGRLRPSMCPRQRPSPLGRRGLRKGESASEAKFRNHQMCRECDNCLSHCNKLFRLSHNVLGQRVDGDIKKDKSDCLM